MIVPDGDVYVIFGDVPRSDGGNIHGIFTTLEVANEEKKNLERIRPFEEFHIEEFGLWKTLI